MYSCSWCCDQERMLIALFVSIQVAILRPAPSRGQLSSRKQGSALRWLALLPVLSSFLLFMRYPRCSFIYLRRGLLRSLFTPLVISLLRQIRYISSGESRRWRYVLTELMAPDSVYRMFNPSANLSTRLTLGCHLPRRSTHHCLYHN